jgi:lysophospholipase L1-like esterase
VKILVIGDSIGLPRLKQNSDLVELYYEDTYPERIRKFALQRFAGEDILLLNSCRHANTSLHLLRGVANDVYFLQPDYVVLQLGMADLWPTEKRSDLPPFPELAGKNPWIGPEEYIQNVERFLQFCFQQALIRIIIVNVPKVSSRQYEKHPNAHDRTCRYNTLLQRFTHYQQVAIVDAYSLFEQLGEGATGSDGIHPTRDSSRQLAWKIVDVLEALEQDCRGGLPCDL